MRGGGSARCPTTRHVARARSCSSARRRPRRGPRSSASSKIATPSTTTSRRRHAGRGGLASATASARRDARLAVLLADDADQDADGAAPSSSVAAELFPDVRRGLLVEWGAWGDRDTADLVLDAHGPGPDRLLRHPPWYVPDEFFHRTVTEFLVEWDRAIGLRPREVSVVGDPLDAPLARGPSPARPQRHPAPFFAVGSDEADGLLVPPGLDAGPQPVVLLHDGRVLVDPSNAELAHSYGLAVDVEDDASSTSSSSVPARPVSRRRCTPRRRACARWSSSASPSAARPARAR